MVGNSMLAMKEVKEERLCEKAEEVFMVEETAILLNETGDYWLAVAENSLC